MREHHLIKIKLYLVIKLLSFINIVFRKETITKVYHYEFLPFSPKLYQVTIHISG